MSATPNRRGRGRLSSNAVLVVISIALVPIAAFLTFEQSLDGPRGYGDVGCNACDVQSYLAMVDGHWPSDVTAPAAVPSPFRYRILVPWLARQLPFRSGDSLKLITYSSLAICYFCILLTCRRLGIGSAAAVTGLVAAAASDAHLVVYETPYLTDGFGLMVLAAMTNALVAEWPWVFAIVGLAGVFAREVTLIFMPAWCVRNVGRGIALSVVAVLAFGIERWIVGPGPAVSLAGTGPGGPTPTFAHAFFYFARERLHDPAAFAVEIVPIWGWVWLCAPIGLMLVPTERFRSVGGAAVFLLGAAFSTTLVASSAGRMLAILLPIMAVGTAQLMAALSTKGRRVWLAVWGGLLILQLFILDPDIMRESPVWREIVPRLRWNVLIGAVGVIFSLGILRNELKQNLREKYQRLPDFLRASKGTGDHQ